MNALKKSKTKKARDMNQELQRQQREAMIHEE
jgi:hypothetical protein